MICDNLNKVKNIGNSAFFNCGNLKKINIPILIFQAENDNLVSPKAQEKFAKRTENTKIIFKYKIASKVSDKLEVVGEVQNAKRKVQNVGTALRL